MRYLGISGSAEAVVEVAPDRLKVDADESFDGKRQRVAAVASQHGNSLCCCHDSCRID
jgi:hypothetical protein